MSSIGNLADDMAALMGIGQIKARAFASRLVGQGWLPRGSTLLGAEASDRTAAILLTAFLFARDAAEIDDAMRKAAGLTSVACLEMDAEGDRLIDTQFPVGMIAPGKAPGMTFIGDLEGLFHRIRTDHSGDWPYRAAWVGLSRDDGKMFAWIIADPVEHMAEEFGPIGAVYGHGEPLTEIVVGRLTRDIVSIIPGRVVERVADLLVATPATPVRASSVATA